MNILSGSSGHQRVDDAFFGQLDVPLPDIGIQQLLIEHIETQRQEAERLCQQAKTKLEAAKRWIEAMLLGEVT